MKNQSLIDYSKNLKRTEFGIKFGKKLFTQPHTLTPKQIALAMRQLGLNLPREVVIAADLAQAISTGQATIAAVESGKNINEITKLSASSVNLFTQLANDLGWVDNETAAYVSLGTDVALLVASLGTDVQAWIGLAIDIVNVTQINSVEAKKLATNALVDWYSTQMKSQSQALSKSFLDMQKGEIGVFGLLAQTADNSPFLFESYIKNNPDLKKLLPGLNFVPVVNWNATFEASRKNLLGSVAHESASINIRTIGEMNEKQAAEFIFDWVIEPFTICYLEAEKFYRSKNLPSLFDISLLWALDTSSNLKYISDSDTQVSKAMLRNLLTPKDLFIDNIFSDYYPENKVSGISGALGNLFTTSEISKNEADQLNQSGDIEKLYSNASTRKALEKKTIYPLIPPIENVPWRESSYKAIFNRSSGETETMLVPDLQSWYGGQATDWRKLQNFIACLDFLDLVYNDPYYKKLNFSLDTIHKYDFFPRLETWKNKLVEVQGISAARKVNKLALTNVAYFLGANSPKQIKMKNKDLVPGVATSFERV